MLVFLAKKSRLCTSVDRGAHSPLVECPALDVWQCTRLGHKGKVRMVAWFDVGCAVRIGFRGPALY